MFIAGTKIEVEVDVRGAQAHLADGRTFEPAAVVVVASSDGTTNVVVRGWPLKSNGERYAKPIEVIPSLRPNEIERYVADAFSLARELMATVPDPTDFLER